MKDTNKNLQCVIIVNLSTIMTQCYQNQLTGLRGSVDLLNYTFNSEVEISMSNIIIILYINLTQKIGRNSKRDVDWNIVHRDSSV